MPSNSSSTIPGLDSLTSATGRSVGSNYHASYLEGVLGPHAGINLPTSVQPHLLRYGRNSENRDREIGSSINSSGNISQQYAAPLGDPYPLALSSMSPTAGVRIIIISIIILGITYYIILTIT